MGACRIGLAKSDAVGEQGPHTFFGGFVQKLKANRLPPEEVDVEPVELCLNLGRIGNIDDPLSPQPSLLSLSLMAIPGFEVSIGLDLQNPHLLIRENDVEDLGGVPDVERSYLLIEAVEQPSDLACDPALALIKVR
jgi:hypothetical protein